MIPTKEQIQKEAFETAIDYKPFETDLPYQDYFEYGFVKGGNFVLSQIGDGWVKVEDGLPEVGQKVYVFRPLAKLTGDSELTIAIYDGRHEISPQGVVHGFDCWCHPSHWHKLPTPPKE